jgi:hypothetical protein
MLDVRIDPELSRLRSRKSIRVGRSLPPCPPEGLASRLVHLCAAGAIAALLCLAAASVALGQVPPPLPEQARLESIVRELSSPEMEGRRGEGARKAAGFLVDRFRRLKLEPLFGDKYVQEIPGAEQGQIQGRNIGGVLHGSDPQLRDEWVILSAHYDHLGVRGGVLYPGADDNASGVAMMLEVARSFVESGKPPKRSLMFIGFDLEEVGLFGSRYFVAHPPVPLDRIALFITADMIGRALAGICDTHVFVLGTEHAPGLRKWIVEAARERPLKVGLLGADVLVLNRSDYGPFRNRRVPFLFFSTGENPRYHSPDDTPETINYPKLREISRLIHQVTRSAANVDVVPNWSDSPEHPLAETETIREVLRQLIDHREKLGLGVAQLFLMNNTLRTVEGILAKGSITPAERNSVIQAARIVLLTIH